MPSTLRYEDYTIGWICALQVEVLAARFMLDEKHSGVFPGRHGDDNDYIPGTINGHNVVIVGLPKKSTGTVSAASLVSQMRQSFPNIRYGLMVGIGAGVPGQRFEPDIRLGDVVVGAPADDSDDAQGVIGYELGKETIDGFIKKGWLYPTDRRLRNALATIQTEAEFNGSHNFLQYLDAFRARPNGQKFLHPGVENDQLYKAEKTGEPVDDTYRLIARNPRDSKDPVVHYGLIASGDKLMKNAKLRDELRDKYNIICFEMEAAGLMNTLPVAVIRGICDYADSHKMDVWHHYAAATAAAYAKGLLYAIGAEPSANPPWRREEATPEMLWSAIDSVIVDRFFQELSAVNREEHKSIIPSLDCDQQKFYWIFRNMDFEQWKSASCSQVLLLFGPPECSIRQVSSSIVNRAKERALHTERCVLYFFCSTATIGKPVVAVFVCTLLYQIVCCSPKNKKVPIVRSFLRTLLDGILRKETASNQVPSRFEEKDSSDTTIEKILDAPTDELWTALKAVLSDEQDRELLIVIDGLDKVQHHKDEFSKGVREFVAHLRETGSKVKALLTSRPQAEIKEVFDGIPCIEYDKERRECLASLRFDNSRYEKISKEHEGCFEWIWTHKQYEQWSASNASRLLYLQGKPGSGKSTLTKYFKDNLLKWNPDAQSAIVAKFFYTYREGELQRSHYNMLRSILYEILYQHEAFFYHRFQSEYRRQTARQKHGRSDLVEWQYESLKRVLLSLWDHKPVERLYLIIDAVDESDDEDRRGILELLLRLCSETKCCVVKVFVASRPVGVLERYVSKFHNFIRLQDETEPDISRFAGSLLKRLEFTGFLEQATEYILKNAQGVFLWVRLVTEELLAYDEEGRAEKDFFEFLKSLPVELEEFYKRMLGKMGRNKADLKDGLKMFRFVLFACRPLAVGELLHTLGIPDNLDTKFTASDESFQISIPFERRITHCGGNFLQIREHHGTTASYEDSSSSQTNELAGNGTVQVMHQTVREFFLSPDGFVANSKFRMSEKDAHICISITCIRYLLLCVASMATRFSDIKSWTSEQYESFAQYLNEKPLANYALGYLKHHIDGCHGAVNVSDFVRQFISGLTCKPVVYFLERCASSYLNKASLSSEEGGAAEDFRNQVLYVAGRKGFSQATEVLLIAGANVNVRDNNRTLLSWAAGEGYEAVVRVLIENGAAIEAIDNHRSTALHWAALYGHDAVVRVLIENGAAIETKDNDESTALHRAAGNGHDAVIRVLTKNGAATEATARNGSTALHWAALFGHDTVVRVLIENGAAIEAKDNHRSTALHWAALHGHDAVVRVLIKNGAAIETKDDDESTALHWAAGEGHDAVVRVLIENGAIIGPTGLSCYGTTYHGLSHVIP